MKITHVVLSVVFALFTAVQYNDPDPARWMLLYGGVAVFCGMAAGGRLYRPAVWVWLAAALAWAASYVPDFIGWLRIGAPSIVGAMKAETPYIENTREFLGLLLAAVCCGWLLIKPARKARHSG